eukprot:c2488_g1_i1.p1 GENE.c2488_g1_i1~~c2488_g1_i1.p1  ORF type:complete len:177 (+),score=43.31 c2488_g1_i1:205-735(+)
MTKYANLTNLEEGNARNTPATPEPRNVVPILMVCAFACTAFFTVGAVVAYTSTSHRVSAVTHNYKFTNTNNNNGETIFQVRVNVDLENEDKEFVQQHLTEYAQQFTDDLLLTKEFATRVNRGLQAFDELRSAFDWNNFFGNDDSSSTDGDNEDSKVNVVHLVTASPLPVPPASSSL